MPKTPSPDVEQRRQRLAEQAQREKAALAQLDKASCRLESANTRHREVIAQADAAVAEAVKSHEKALAAYTRHAGPGRAAYLLGMDERDLRRLGKESAS